VGIELLEHGRAEVAADRPAAKSAAEHEEIRLPPAQIRFATGGQIDGGVDEMVRCRAALIELGKLKMAQGVHPTAVDVLSREPMAEEIQPDVAMPNAARPFATRNEIAVAKPIAIIHAWRQIIDIHDEPAPERQRARDYPDAPPRPNVEKDAFAHEQENQQAKQWRAEREKRDENFLGRAAFEPRGDWPQQKWR